MRASVALSLALCAAYFFGLVGLPGAIILCGLGFGRRDPLNPYLAGRLAGAG